MFEPDTEPRMKPLVQEIAADLETPVSAYLKLRAGGARFLLDPRRKHHPSLLSAEGAQARLGFLLRCVEAAAELGAPIAIISTGPDREETIVLRHPFD